MRFGLRLVSALLVAICANSAAPAQQPPPAESKDERQIAEQRERIFQLEAVIRTLEQKTEKGAKKDKPAAPKLDVSFITLKNVDAAGLAKTLTKLYHAKDSTTLGIAADPATNTILVRGSPSERTEIEAVVSRLEELFLTQRLVPKKDPKK